jgi:hypothetical protein
MQRDDDGCGRMPSPLLLALVAAVACVVPARRRHARSADRPARPVIPGSRTADPLYAVGVKGRDAGRRGVIVLRREPARRAADARVRAAIVSSPSSRSPTTGPIPDLKPPGRFASTTASTDQSLFLSLAARASGQPDAEALLLPFGSNAMKPGALCCRRRARIDHGGQGVPARDAAVRSCPLSPRDRVGVVDPARPRTWTTTDPAVAAALNAPSDWRLKTCRNRTSCRSRLTLQGL